MKENVTLLKTTNQSQQSFHIAQSIRSLSPESKKTGRWTMEEHFRFLEAL